MTINGLLVAQTLQDTYGLSFDVAQLSAAGDILYVQRLDDCSTLSADTLYITTASELDGFRGQLFNLQLFCIEDQKLPVWCEYQRDVTILLFSENTDPDRLLTDTDAVLRELLHTELQKAAFFDACNTASNYSQLISAASKVCQYPLAFADHNGRLLAISNHNSPDTLWNQIREIGSAQFLKLFQATEQLSRIPNTNIYYQRLSQWDVQCGTLLMLCEHGSPPQTLRESLDSLILFICKMMSKHVSRPLSERQKFDDFILSLLAGQTYPEKTITERIEPFFDHHSAEYHICVIEFGSRDPAQDYKRFSNAFKPDDCCEFLYYYDHLGVLITKLPPVRHFFRNDNLIDILKENNWHIGIGQPLKNGIAIRQSFLQADRALYFGRLLDDNNTAYLYDDYASFHILDCCAQSTDLYQYCILPVRVLYEYDCKNDGDLLKTLDVYLAQNRNTVATANKLFVHRNTVSYRIMKCKEIMGIDFEAGGEMFNVEMSIRIIRYIKAMIEH